ncbi:MAG TPA: chromosome segregation protein SMC [Dissulfurispiraceae bacterium]|nr:chromosome segregation protein SMC [Dissulfurispiraceae bacterium]
MKIKGIELNGFKSFSDRTVLSLHDGVTVIVGPNGCGKSNIVDAFRWVLGEQSARSLRGEKMDEVIFQGSSTRKPKGVAEVTLSIFLTPPQSKEASNKTELPKDDDASHDSVVVARRLYRSGESDYLLNKRSCRLKDIKDLFLDTGLDVKSYSILDQGRIGEILNAKPIDRRFLIEEVAGVMKYKVRKAEALSKLASSKENIQRINDIIHEVKRQLNSLDRQVKKAERYKRLIDELKDIELRIARREFLRLSEQLAGVTAELEQLREADAGKRADLSTAENQLETERVGVVEKEKALAALEQTLYDKERSVAETEKKIAVLKTTVENIRNDIVRLTSIETEGVARKTGLAERLVELEGRERSHHAHIEQMSDALQEKREATASIEAAIAEQESVLEENRKSLFIASDRLSSRRNELSRLQSSSETLAYKESVALRDKEAITQGIAAAEAGISGADVQITGANTEIVRLKTEAEQLAAGAEVCSRQIEEKKAEVAQERETLAANTSRISSLKELILDKTLRDFFADSSNRLQASSTVLSDILSSDKEHEVAIEAALSEKLNSLILDSPEDVLAAVNVVREKQLGRTSIFYTGLGTKPGTVQAGAPPIAGHPAVLGKASDFIKTEHVAAGRAVSSVLDNAYIARDLGAAIGAFQSHLGGSCVLITLDGEVISSDGFITAGQGKDILKRKREIKELQQTVEKQQKAIITMEQELLTKSEELSVRLDSIRETGSAVVEAEKKLSLLQHQHAAHVEERERRERRRFFLETELASIASEKESLKAALEAKSREISQLEIEHQTVNVAMAEIQVLLAGVREEYEQERVQIEDMRLEITSFREKLLAVTREKQVTEDAIAETEEKNSIAAEDIAANTSRIEESVAKLRQMERSIKSSVEEAATLRQAREHQREAIAAEKECLLGFENGLRKLRAEIDELSQRLSDRRSASVEQRMKLESIASGMHQKYGIGIAQAEIAIEGFDPAEDAEKVGHLNDKIRELGPVNLGTLEEYDELKNRHDFLTKQQEDLTMSIAELEEAISRINLTTRRKLREAYDALRAKFSEVFTTLFGGGRADIVLTDEENILEAGLDIIAQPPGKKLQNINLLSGGEKALTSLSLLFAGFLLKPSPLCILDEADATLDESNTTRFAQMIRELSRDTQFVVITHNRTTMEAADNLYGITMEEPGASKTISLQLSEIEAIGVA